MQDSHGKTKALKPETEALWLSEGDLLVANADVHWREKASGDLGFEGLEA